ncbi:MAG TPA: amidohydrolase family protein, partial [Candidatus Avanaerovorax faecigallinarum]|nr:amidohydrolase family protein [Candidatus Avanaerovorax faecigallinarum]
KEGMAVAIHCIGDAAAEQAVTAIEAARAEYPDVSTRDGIVHAQILNEDIMERMRKGGIIAYIQPVFIEYDLHVAESRVGKERMKTSYNWRTLRDMGIKTPFGTDCPVETFNPMPNIYTAVTRKDYDGFPEGGWYPEEGLTVVESVEDYTKTSAFACNAESHRGMIAEGFDADITVLEENLFEAEPAHIKDIKAAMTIVGGKIRFSRI